MVRVSDHSKSLTPESAIHVRTMTVNQRVAAGEILHADAQLDPEATGEAFREHRADLLIAVSDPLILANSLYSKRIISRETLDQTLLPSLTISNKNFILLDAIEARIRTHPSDFLTLLTILDQDACLCIFAERLRNSYS